MSSTIFNSVSLLLSHPARRLIPISVLKRLPSSKGIIDCTKYDHYVYKRWTHCGYQQVLKRSYSDKKDVSVREGSNNELQTDVKVTVKEATKTASYSAVILLGMGITAALFYAVFRELFSSKSPSGIYAKAFKVCSEDTRVQDALGTPIKGYGEETSRGRRRHVSHLIYEKNGIPHMRMVFYLKGCRNTATVQLEVKENSSGDYEFRYLFVQLDDYTRRVIVLEDNRGKEEAAKSFLTPLDDLNVLK